MSLQAVNNGQRGFPGVTTTEYPEQAEFMQGRNEHLQLFKGRIASTTVDAQNDTTTVLRSGLIMGETSTGELAQYDPTLAAGSPQASCLLYRDTSMMGVGNAVEDKFIGDIVGLGLIDPSQIVIGSSSTRGIVGNAYEFAIRKQLSAAGFVFEDQRQEVPLMSWKYANTKTADYTLLDTDRDILWDNTGDVDALEFTLPTTAKKDLAFYFYVTADQSVTITAGTADTMFAFNDLAADSIAFSTAGEKLGACLAVIGDGAKWKTFNLSSGAHTLTVAT